MNFDPKLSILPVPRGVMFGARSQREDQRVERLERELDQAINQARLLREQFQPAAAPPVEEWLRRARREVRRRRLHAWLNRIQSLTPGFLRALVRGAYLNLFYYRVYPEYSPRATHATPPASLNALTAYSGYAPMLAFKQRLCRELGMDLRGISTPCRPGLASVVLPVHNGAAFVAHAIESALAQTYRDFELIVVDDGSSDETPSILRRYAGDRRVRIVSQENKKLPGALNAGFAEATGEFFTWISADNLMRPDMLAELTSFLRSRGDVEMVYADEELIDEAGRPARNADFCAEYQAPLGSHTLSRPMDPGELNFVPNNFIGGCFLYRAWAARITGAYDEACFGFEDYEYWMRMNALFRVAHLGRRQVLYSYRLHPDSLTSRARELQIAERARWFKPVEAERRNFFAESFDITLVGGHPWFAELAGVYRRSGHNAMEFRTITPEALYRHQAARAFSKSIVITDGPRDLGCFALLRGGRLSAAGYEWTATSASSLAYPLLALANSVLWSDKQTACRASH